MSMEKYEITDGVRLYGKQTAEQGKCGSCRKFRREPYVGNGSYAPTDGRCMLVFPAWMRVLHMCAELDKAGKEFSEAGDWQHVKDTDACSFYDPRTDVTFIKDQTWSVGEPG